MSESKTKILDSIKRTLTSSSEKRSLPELPQWGLPIDNPVERFKFEWERNSGELVTPKPIYSNLINETIHKYLTVSLHSKSIWITDEPICKGGWNKKFQNVYVGDNIDTKNAALCDTAISGCELILSETGTIAVCSRPGRPRALTLLPPNVLFISYLSQIVPKMEDALSKLATQAPHGWVWISGPSRTADIEKVLVKGVHGPKRVAVLLIDDTNKKDYQ